MQERIIGYYEGWNYNSGCTGVLLQNIPVGSLTHLNLAFLFITPGTFDIAMMPGVPQEVITKIMDLKKQNPFVKIMASIGGWSFNDNGTDTQPVFGQMVGNPAIRLGFIAKLFAFLYQYGFDGVDIDWECKPIEILVLSGGALAHRPISQILAPETVVGIQKMDLT